MRKVKIIVFIVALIAGLSFAKMFAFSTGLSLPSFSLFSKVKGSGNTRIEKRDVSDFSSVKAGGAVTVEIAAQRDFNVEVEADDNLLEHIKTEVNGDTLRIYTEGSIRTRNPIRVRISMPQIESLDISGASVGTVTGVRNESLKIDASGASKIKIDGETGELNVDLSGASRVDAENLRAESVTVDASGASKATVTPLNELNADASGASCISYTGEPKSIDKRTSGASSVKQK
ncbi:MAG TPA: head GIN domain-containing protein [Pyrinomonadaceae bacterium]|nr:head GIN domain-containing protein [Pyrinomonadaceae bacterium]